jgi:hypothetical protein
MPDPDDKSGPDDKMDAKSTDKSRGVDPAETVALPPGTRVPAAPIDAPSLPAARQAGECPAGFKRVNQLQSCLLTLQDGSQLRVGFGTQYLPEEVADHWWVRHHSDDPPVAEVKPGTAAALEAQMREAAGANVADAVIEQAAMAAANKVRDMLRKDKKGR